MSFGGVVSAMITSLKNNNRTRKSAIENLERFRNYKQSENQLYFQKKATDEQLQKIKKDILRENYRTTLFSSIAILCIMITIMILLINI